MPSPQYSPQNNPETSTLIGLPSVPPTGFHSSTQAANASPASGVLAPPWLTSQLQPGERVALVLGPSLWLAMFRRPRFNLLCWLIAAVAFPLAAQGWLPLVAPAALAGGAIGLLAISLLLGVISCAAEHYILTDTRLVVLRGVASRRSVQVRWGDVREIAHQATWVQRPLGLGDVQILTAAPSGGCTLRYIRAPHLVCASLEQQRIAATRSRQQAQSQSQAQTQLEQSLSR